MEGWPPFAFISSAAEHLRYGETWFWGDPSPKMYHQLCLGQTRATQSKLELSSFHHPKAFAEVRFWDEAPHDLAKSAPTLLYPGRNLALFPSTSHLQITKQNKKKAHPPKITGFQETRSNPAGLML